MRRGAYVLPKFIGGKPLDQLSPELGQRGCPFQLTRPLLMRQINAHAGADGDLRAADARPQARPGAPDRVVRPARRASATGGSRSSPTSSASTATRCTSSTAPASTIDTIVWCTGYRITFPFLDDALIGTAGQPGVALPARGAPRPRRALLHRAGPAARRDHADRRAPVRVDRRPARGQRRPAGPASACSGRSSARTRRCAGATSPPRGTRSRWTSTPYMRTLARERKRRRGVKRPLPAAARRAAGSDLPA